MAHNNEYESSKMRAKGYSEMDVALASMKRTPKEKDEKYEAEMIPPSMDEYPYGLKLDLDTETLDKLGVKDMKSVGDYCYISAVGKVTRVSESQNEYDDGEEKRDMCLQITKMSIEDYTMDDEDVDE
jgi:hypothetical protein